MRVYQLNTYCGVKSTGRIALEIAKMVEMDGGACRIGYGVPDISPEAERYSVRIGTSAERKLHGAMRKLIDAEGYGSLFATHRLIADMRSFQPDLVQLHNLHGCYLHLPTLFRYLQHAQLPVVWTLHDCWPFTGHCAYFDYAQCERWQTLCHNCPQQHSYPVCIGLDGSRRNYRMKKTLFSGLEKLTFVAPCEWMKGPLNQSFLGGRPVRVIPNGVNLDTFHPVNSDLRVRLGLSSEQKRLVLAVAAEWDERKGLRYLVEAKQLLGDGYRIAVIGVSPEQASALCEGITGIAQTASTEELAAWYTAADCFANPTMEDNMPMVNLEALACGTPIAAFATGGCPEAVGDDCGLIVPKGDVQALADAIRTLCTAKPAMKDACLQRARAFDCQLTFKSYLSLYKELVK